MKKHSLITNEKKRIWLTFVKERENIGTNNNI